MAATVTIGTPITLKGGPLDGDTIKWCGGHSYAVRWRTPRGHIVKAVYRYITDAAGTTIIEGRFAGWMKSARRVDHA